MNLAAAAYAAAAKEHRPVKLAELKLAKAAAKAERAELRAVHAAGLRALHLQFNADAAAAREASGLYRGNYMDVREDFDAAAKRAACLGVLLDPDKPARCLTAMKTPRPYVSEDALNGSCTWLQLDMGADERHTRHPHPVMRLRIGSDERRKPIWADARITYHRPLPPAAEVLRASFVRIARNKWCACITVKEQDPASDGCGRTVKVAASAEGGCMATWTANDGASGTIELAGIEAALAHADSIERTLWDVCRAEVPGSPLDQKTCTPHALARWARWCRKENAAADAYVRRYEHLWNWVCGERRGAQNGRRDVYRKAAAMLCEGAVRVEFEGVPAPRWAALSELKLALASACARRGVEFASGADLRRANQRRPSNRSRRHRQMQAAQGVAMAAQAEAGQGLRF
ncbi:MAG: hypothetical protein ACRD2E_11525 [Terriglobales bacterium]